MRTLRGASVLFFSGYLAALKIRDEKLYRQTVDGWLIGNIVPSTIIEMIWRSGASDWDANIITKMLKEKRIAPAQIRMFLYGAWFKAVSVEVFIDFLKQFTNIADEKNCSAIIGIVDQYIESHPQLLEEKELIKNILSKSSIENTMDNYYWNKLLKSLTEKYPETIPSFAELTLEKLQNNMTFEDNIPERLSQFLKRNPEGTWLTIKQKLNAGDLTSWRLVEIIRGQLGFGTNEKSLLNLIPEKCLWEWLDENPKKAPYLLARMIPLKQAEPILHPIARKLILRYPENKELRNTLLDNWFTEGFSGRASEHYKRKLGSS